MKLDTLLLFSIFSLLFISCNGQNSSQSQDGLRDKNSQRAIGHVVQKLGTNIMTIYQDKKNIYWFGSNGQGVYRYDGKEILHIR